MSDSDLICGLCRIKVETGSLVCLGCGHEHNCSTHGCALINAAIARLEVEKAEAALKKMERADNA